MSEPKRLDRPDREKIAEFLYSENEPTLIYDGVTFDKCGEIYPEKVESYLEQADQILALFIPDIEEAKKHTVEFIESYLVTTIQPDGTKMHHMDDEEWKSVKQRILGQALNKTEGGS